MPESDQRQEMRREADVWHVVKGVPVAVLLAFVVQTLVFIGVGGWTARGFVAQQEKFSEALTTVRTDIGEIKGQVTGLSNTVQSGNVPAALNLRRIEDLERQVSQLNQLPLRVNDNERRISAMDGRMAATEARARARGER